MENVNSAEIITEMKQHEIQPPVGRNIIILTTYQNLLNTLKETSNIYSNGRFHAQLFHRNTLGRT